MRHASSKSALNGDVIRINFYYYKQFSPGASSFNHEETWSKVIPFIRCSR